jgi:hypothetical protein
MDKKNLTTQANDFNNSIAELSDEDLKQVVGALSPTIPPSPKNTPRVGSPSS